MLLGKLSLSEQCLRQCSLVVISFMPLVFLISTCKLTSYCIFFFQNGKIYSEFGISGQLMSLLYCGSIESVGQVLIQIFSMGFLRAIMVAIVLSFHKIVRDGLKERQQTESAKDK